VNLQQDAAAKALREAKFQEQVAQLNERRVAQGQEAVARARTGAPSFHD
jgi:nitrate/nitrite transport system permease protein